jgi:CAAX protease family protein
MPPHIGGGDVDAPTSPCHGAAVTRSASEVGAPGRRPDPPRTLVLVWAAVIAGIGLAALAAGALPRWIDVAGVAALLFVIAPDLRLRARGEDWDRYGLPPLTLREPAARRAWARGLGAGLASSALVLPAFVAIFAAYAWLLPHLAPALARHATPYLAPGRIALRFPDGFPLQIVLQPLAVALPEELFYRGWVQTSWARRAPERGVTVLGTRLGAGFLWTQVLFAAGHLVRLQPWRLGTFLPGLWFGWLREKTGSVAAPVVAHALSNLLIMVLEASFYGR